MLIKRIILFLDINKDHLVKIKKFVNLINAEKLPITSLANENNKQIIYKFSDLLFRNIYIAKKCNINKRKINNGIMTNNTTETTVRTHYMIISVGCYYLF